MKLEEYSREDLEAYAAEARPYDMMGQVMYDSAVSELKRRGQLKVNVFVREEYGYRLWLWRSGMTEKELIDFWRSQQNFWKVTPSEHWPGEWLELHERGENLVTSEGLLYSPSELEDMECQAHVHDDDDSELVIAGFTYKPSRRWKQ